MCPSSVYSAVETVAQDYQIEQPDCGARLPIAYLSDLSEVAQLGSHAPQAYTHDMRLDFSIQYNNSMNVLI